MFDPALSLTLRPITEADMGFLRELYGTTRAAEMQVVPWSEEQKNQFLDMQFHAQHTYYQEAFPETAFDLILLDGNPIGRLYVLRDDSQFNILDIAIMPDHRSQGIGTYYLQAINEEATVAGVPVSIHVECYNPALRLYERLGFRRIGETGVHYVMQWTPQEIPASC